MCSKRSNECYIAKPHLPDLVDWESMDICKACAKREIGSKNKKQWERIHGNSNKKET